MPARSAGTTSIARLRPLAVAMAMMAAGVAVADNPIVSQVYTADPAARVIGDRVYVMVTHDQDNQQDYGELKDYYLFSSDDMVNWQDHGVVFDVDRDSTWANLAYAPDFIERDGRFYLYYPDGANAVGVAVADSPEGPYSDPLGRPLVDRNTPGAENVQWVFDPGVFIDDDGSAYLYFGGGAPGNLRGIRLNDDMISVSGRAQTIDAPNYFEAPYLNKRNGTYYLSYSTNGDNGSITIDYLTSSNPLSGFVHRGTVLNNPWDNQGNNNHQSIVEFQGQWYIFYHNRGVSGERGAGPYQRSINVDYLDWSGDTMSAADTRAGVEQLKYVDAFTRNEAETLDNEMGIESTPNGNESMSVMFDSGDWIQISGVDFGAGADGLQASVAAASATRVDIYLDAPDGAPAGSLEIPATGGLQAYQTTDASLSTINGVHDVYLRAAGRVNMDWYEFLEPAPSSSSSSSSEGGGGGGSARGTDLLLGLLAGLIALTRKRGRRE